METAGKRKSNPWVATAHEELRKIIERYGFDTSLRKLSEKLNVDSRTLGKIFKHDHSVKLESIERIYGRLMVLRCSLFTADQWEKEKRWLQDSRFRITMCFYEPTDDVESDVLDAVQGELMKQHQRGNGPMVR